MREAAPRPDLEARVERALKAGGLVAGPLFAALVYLAHPGPPTQEARWLLAILAIAIVWWMTEAIPLPATALVAAALAIVTGVAPARQVLAPFADPVIFLFLGSFLLAEAVSRYGLDARLARRLLGFRLWGRSGSGRLAAFGTASAAISTVLSNTASAALMTPIAVGALGPRDEQQARKLDSGVLLMIAYGASIGGMATLIGTPPNLLVAGFLHRLVGVDVSFTGWLLFALPIALVLLLVSLVVTRYTLGRELAAALQAVELPQARAAGDGESRAGARWTVVAFSLAFTLWLAPSVADALLGHTHPFAEGLGRHLPEAGVALLCASLLFVAPVSLKRSRFALAWTDAQRINWGVLLLFGGGLSLGTLAQTTGIAQWAGEGVVRSGLAQSPTSFMLLATVTAVTISEFASNTASATLLVPIVIAAAQQAGFDPVPPALAAGLAATCGFVFPVSTPPNAIVFGTGRVPITRMIRVGILLDVACVVIVWLGVLLLQPLLPHAG